MTMQPLTGDEESAIISTQFDDTLDHVCIQVGIAECMGRALARKAGEEYDDEPLYWDSEGYAALAALIQAGFLRADDFVYDEETKSVKRSS